MLYVIQVTVYMVEFVTMTAKRHHQHHSDGKQQESQIAVPAVVVFIVRFYVEHIFSLVLFFFVSVVSTEESRHLR